MKNTIERSLIVAIANKASAKVADQPNKLYGMNLEDPERFKEKLILVRLKHNASAATLNAGSVEI